MYVLKKIILFCRHICIVQRIDLDFRSMRNKKLILLLIYTDKGDVKVINVSWRCKADLG